MKRNKIYPCFFSSECYELSEMLGGLRISPFGRGTILQGKVLNYLEAMRFHYGKDVLFICGYEAGCLGFILYRDLTAHNMKCVIPAPATMAVPAGKKQIKTDKRDAALIARCLAHYDYSEVNVPTEKDEQIKEFIRMRDDHKLALKKVKQQILSLCLRHGIQYDGTKSHWTQAHINWLRSLKLDDVDQETLDEYLLSCDYFTKKLERLPESDDYLCLRLPGKNRSIRY